ncbi:MAG: chromosome segregation protein SMC, partial [Firmicutes bacterium]|nr:chromosome segregation protein SMC [Bacillota bacterium]
MYLKRLELQGFKSFADKTALEFMPGITTVIGPNGSGKSNISDSIRWVLGEQSMKELRGSISSDVIFSGTENRKSLGFAEASIIIDNEDGKLPIEYGEVTITRRLYRSGDTGYFINKTPCRLKDVLELFMDTGIGKDGYSIIGQGKIDEILSNKSEDRRHIFEEAAGIVKYKARKTDSEKKLEQTKINLLRINDILSEIESNIEPLKLQSEKARKFLDLREELKSIEIGLFIHNIEGYKTKIAGIVKDVDIYESQAENEDSRMNDMHSSKDKLKLEIDELIATIEETQNLGFEASTKIEKINSDINVVSEKISNNKENHERFEKEIEEVTARIAELEDEKKQRLEKKVDLSLNREKFAKELEEKELLLAEITNKLSEEEAEIEAKKKKIEENTDLKYEKRELINTQEVNYENLEKREKQVKNEIDSAVSELDETRLKKEEMAKIFHEIESKKAGSTKQLEDVGAGLVSAQLKIADYENQINSLSSEYRIKESKLKFLAEMEREKEGYARSVKTLLLDCEKDTALSKGVHGVLANLISVPEKYETAIEMALGAALQNIVTDTEEDAKRLIEHLRKNNLGRASFLPISAVKGKKTERLIKNNLSGVIGIAADLIKYDSKYEGVILNLLGKTVIADNMDTAIVLARQNGYSFRIVTLKGDIVNPSGLMTGGSTKERASNIMGRAAQIEVLTKELKALEEKLAKIKKDKIDYEKSISGVLAEMESLKKAAQETEIIYATELQKFQSMEENTEKAAKKLAGLKEELAQIISQKQENVELKEALEAEAVTLEKEIEELNIPIKAFAEKNKDNQKYIDDLNFDITNLKISVSSFDESSISIDELAARIDQDIEKSSSSIANKKELMDKITEDNKLLEEEITSLNNQIEEIKRDVSTSGDKIEELKKNRTEKNAELAELEEAIENQLAVLERIRTELSKLELKKSKLEIELEQVVNKMWEDYEVTPNNAEVATEALAPLDKGGMSRSDRGDIPKLTKRAKSLREEIKELGSINIDSIEEYKQTKDRYDFMCEQRLDLEDSSSKLRKVISDMTKIMKEQFGKQFKIINKSFG